MTRKKNLPVLNRDDAYLHAREIEKELNSLKEAQKMIENDESVSDSAQNLITKWKNSKPRELTIRNKPSSKTQAPKPSFDLSLVTELPTVNSEPLFKRLEKDAKELQKEKETSNNRIRLPRDHQIKTLEIDNQRLKRKLKKLSAQKSHDVYSNELQEQRFKKAILREKYKDVLKYATELEAENASLKMEERGRKEKKGASVSLPRCQRRDESKEPHECDETVPYTNIDDVDALKSSAYQEAEKDLEKKWHQKVLQVEEVYERVIEGYKDHVKTKQEQLLVLQQQREKDLQYMAAKEKEVSHKHEEDLQRIQTRMTTLQEGRSGETVQLVQNRIDNLEKIIADKDGHIESLLSQQPDAANIKEYAGKIESSILERVESAMKDALVGNTSERNRITLMQSFKDVFKESLKDWQNSEDFKFFVRQPGVAIGNPDAHSCPACQEHKNKVEKLTEGISSLKIELESEKHRKGDNQKIFEKLKLQQDNLEQKLQERDSKQNDPQMLKQLEHFMSEFEKAKQESERLKHQVNHLEAERQQVNSDSKRHEYRISSLESEISAKNGLLNMNSAQLEERIRENANLNSQIERLKEENLKQSHLQKSGEHSLQAQMKELHSQNEKLRNQLTNFRRDKEQLERSFKSQTKSFEEKIQELTLKSLTHQRQFETISNSYKTIFGNRDAFLVPRPMPEHDSNHIHTS